MFSNLQCILMHNSFQVTYAEQSDNFVIRLWVPNWHEECNLFSEHSNKSGKETFEASSKADSYIAVLETKCIHLGQRNREVSRENKRPRIQRTGNKILRLSNMVLLWHETVCLHLRPNNVETNYKWFQYIYNFHTALSQKNNPKMNGESSIFIFSLAIH